MRKRVFVVFAVLLVLVIALSAGLYLTSGKNEADSKQENLVGINEVQKLLEDGDEKTASEKLSSLSEDIRKSEAGDQRDRRILVIGGVCVLGILAAGIYVYVTVLRPLKKISKYTSEIARGNTDIPLTYDRGSEVGEFSWAFDSMRKELNKARASEKEAIENNKTVIATLSHDIKTPIASIRAYAEGLEANMDSSPEKRAQYLQVIMKKSDEVSKVTDDLLLHSLSDMNRLKVELKEFEISSFVESAVKDLDPDEKEISYISGGVKEFVNADPDRLLQCVENLITNSRKYAGTKITVALEKAESTVSICIKDSGKGIPDEDMPFIFDKFYRGHNRGSRPGSGLGLYIVKYLMTKMDGDIILQNTPDGLLAKLVLPVKEKLGS
ncbi:MAG: HAMP domain-containing histidine kinase [Clostridiales bacterium]|nr:HAMP domain-containing histidine kinase [Clostridiales bacterium]